MRWLENPYNGWIDNKDIVIENELFSRTIGQSKNEIKVDLNMSNYGTKSDLKNNRCWYNKICQRDWFNYNCKQN